MVKLHTAYIDGDILTANNPVGGSIVAASGLNNITLTINQGGYIFPQNYETTNYVMSSGVITDITISGTNHFYQMTGSYNTDRNPFEITVSGLTLGSTITYNYFYQTGSLSSSNGVLISGNVILS